MTDPATTWALLAAGLRHPYDLVAVGDAIVRADRMPGPRSRILRPALATFADLDAAIADGRRGVRSLRDARKRVRIGAASRMETWMRLTVVDAGLPEPVLDHDVYDAFGRFLGCLDAAYPEARVGRVLAILEALVSDLDAMLDKQAAKTARRAKREREEVE